MQTNENTLKPLSEFITRRAGNPWTSIHVDDFEQVDLGSLPEGLSLSIDMCLPDTVIRREGTKIVATVTENLDLNDPPESRRFVRAWMNAVKIVAAEGHPLSGFTSKQEEPWFSVTWELTSGTETPPAILLKSVRAAYRAVTQKADELTHLA